MFFMERDSACSKVENEFLDRLTVPDLRTERSRVVESGLSPAKRNAASFATEFGCGEWGRVAGLWHDL